MQTTVQTTTTQIQTKAKELIALIYKDIYVEKQIQSFDVANGPVDFQQLLALLMAEFPNLMFKVFQGHVKILIGLNRYSKCLEVLTVYRDLYYKRELTFKIYGKASGEIVYQELKREFPMLDIKVVMCPYSNMHTITIKFNENSSTELKSNEEISSLEPISEYQTHIEKLEKFQLEMLQKALGLNDDRCIYRSQRIFDLTKLTKNNTEEMEKHGYKVIHYHGSNGIELEWKFVSNSAHSDKLQRHQLEELKKLVDIKGEKCIFEVTSVHSDPIFTHITESNIKEMEKYGYSVFPIEKCRVMLRWTY